MPIVLEVDQARDQQQKKIENSLNALQGADIGEIGLVLKVNRAGYHCACKPFYQYPNLITKNTQVLPYECF